MGMVFNDYESATQKQDVWLDMIRHRELKEMNTKPNGRETTQQNKANSRKHNIVKERKSHPPGPQSTYIQNTVSATSPTPSHGFPLVTFRSSTDL